VTKRIASIVSRVIRGDWSALHFWNVLYPAGTAKTDYIYRTQTRMDLAKAVEMSPNGGDEPLSPGMASPGHERSGANVV
jgi:hypothetical protein